MQGGGDLITFKFLFVFHSATHIFSNTQIILQPKALPIAFYFLVERWKMLRCWVIFLLCVCFLFFGSDTLLREYI